MIRTYCKDRLERVMGMTLTVAQYRYLLNEWAAFSTNPEAYRNLVPMIKDYMKDAGYLVA